MGQTAPSAGSMWQPEFSSEYTSVTNTEAANSHPGMGTSQPTNPFSGASLQTQGGTPQHLQQHMDAQRFASANSSCTFDPFSTQQGQPKIGSDIDSALSNLADNLSISGNNQGRPVQWGGPQQQGQPQMQIPSSVTAPSVGAPPMASYGAPPQYTTPFGQYAPQAYPGGHMPQWQVQPHVFPAPQHPQGAPSGYPVYGGAPMGYGQVAQPHPQSGQDPFGF
ncbi:hypothetical protein TELCIR_06714 [Teladorsagia circumcincta]|uniref:Uncharacterized protein n=1 Tax=Teladorsagia circumcincta TaxID=45464 RepID=A0A2G9UMN0_TELCI|nr:hypothetical protein TELCIR_06714 [Teladorsagia circumcincta]